MLNVNIVVMYMHVKNDFTFLVFISVSYDYHFFKNSPKCRLVSQIRKKKTYWIMFCQIYDFVLSGTVTILLLWKAQISYYSCETKNVQ